MIGLLMQRPDGTQPPMSERIKLLNELGLTRTEIGEVVGKEPNYIGAVLGRKKSDE